MEVLHTHGSSDDTKIRTGALKKKKKKTTLNLNIKGNMLWFIFFFANKNTKVFIRLDATLLNHTPFKEVIEMTWCQTKMTNVTKEKNGKFIALDIYRRCFQRTISATEDVSRRMFSVPKRDVLYIHKGNFPTLSEAKLNRSRSMRRTEPKVNNPII